MERLIQSTIKSRLEIFVRKTTEMTEAEAVTVMLRNAICLIRITMAEHNEIRGVMDMLI
jgi:seryl-tRNA(Sec) selenium transferase